MARILIVNREPDVALIVRAEQWFRQSEADIMRAEDGDDVEFADTHAAGLARVASDDPHPLDVAVVEWGPSVRAGKPGLGGALNILDAYVAAGRRHGVPIIVLSTYVVNEDLNAQALPHGAAALVKMPFSPTGLLEEINRILAA